jgi:hypothetical protein
VLVLILPTKLSPIQDCKQPILVTDVFVLCLVTSYSLLSIGKEKCIRVARELSKQIGRTIGSYKTKQSEITNHNMHVCGY